MNWPLAPPKNIKDLVHLEAVHDVLDLYLWLRYIYIFFSKDEPKPKPKDEFYQKAINKCPFSPDVIHNLNPLGLTPFCSYRFMDMFPDANLIREIQQELDGIIQVGVRNITRLIRATENHSAETTASIRLPDSDTLPQRRGRVLKAHNQRKELRPSDSSLSSRLLRDGLLTKELLEQLQKEWVREQSQHGDDFVSTNKGKRKKK